MNQCAVIFDQIEWQSPQRGMRCKVFRDGSRQLRLVEFSDDFIGDQWCGKGHAGFVLSGVLAVDFSGRVERFPEGSALVIPSGPAHAHKARAVTATVRLFLVESLPDEFSAAPNEPAGCDWSIPGGGGQAGHDSLEARGMLHSVTELPFNSFLGIEVATRPDQVLRLPSGARYLNHLGTVHASAQLALAEASSGEYLLRALGSISGVVPVVRRLESKFRKPANGALTSTASAAPEVVEQLRADLAAKGRAIISVAVELHDESGAHTLSATVEWFITRIH